MRGYHGDYEDVKRKTNRNIYSDPENIALELRVYIGITVKLYRLKLEQTVDTW